MAYAINILTAVGGWDIYRVKVVLCMGEDNKSGTSKVAAIILIVFLTLKKKSQFLSLTSIFRS